MHGLRMVHADLKGVYLFFQTKGLYAYASLIYEGKHLDQQARQSLPRRLRSFDHRWDRDSRRRRGIAGVTDLR
jgi:hypothetical protein